MMKRTTMTQFCMVIGVGEVVAGLFGGRRRETSAWRFRQWLIGAAAVKGGENEGLEMKVRGEERVRAVAEVRVVRRPVVVRRWQRRRKGENKSGGRSEEERERMRVAGRASFGCRRRRGGAVVVEYGG